MYNLDRKYGINWQLKNFVNYLISLNYVKIDDYFIDAIITKLNPNKVRKLYPKNVILDTLSSNNELGKILNSEEYCESENIIETKKY